MPANPTAAHSGDRSRRCLILTASEQSTGECGRVVRISRRSTSLPSSREIRHGERGLAQSISMLWVIAEGVAS
jgi:hypothetical protein